MPKAQQEFLNFLSIKYICLIVTETPEANKIRVLIRGTFKQSKDWTEKGGQVNLVSIVGDMKKWK